MHWEPVRKPTTWAVEPNLVDYDDARRSFTWDAARAAARRPARRRPQHRVRGRDPPRDGRRAATAPR